MRNEPAEHVNNTSHPFHLIALASNEKHIPAPLQGDAFNSTPAPVGEPIIHQAAYAQTSGEAVYIDDIPTPKNCLFAAIVGSPVTNYYKPTSKLRANCESITG